MTNAIAFDKLEVWFRYPRPNAARRASVVKQLTQVDRFRNSALLLGSIAVAIDWKSTATLVPKPRYAGFTSDFSTSLFSRPFQRMAAKRST